MVITEGLPNGTCLTLICQNSMVNNQKELDMQADTDTGRKIRHRKDPHNGRIMAYRWNTQPELMPRYRSAFETIYFRVPINIDFTCYKT